MKSKWNWLIRIMVLLLFLADLTACTSAEQEQEQELVYVGRVIDRNTQEPIKDATVTLDFRGAPSEVYTDSAGVYRFVVVMTGTRLDGSVRVSAEGYEKYDRYITLYTTSSTVEDLRLSPETRQAETIAPPAAEPTLIVLTAVPTLPTATLGPTTTFTPTPKPPTPTAPPTPDFNEPLANVGRGDQWVRPKDNMTMRFVPSDTFPMGSEDGNDDESPVHNVTLDSFWIDETEVTNLQYAQCVLAEECEQSIYATDADYNEAQPVVGVSWEDAVTYCRWVEARLPTEAEWEYAARGPAGNTYPWGEADPNCTFANFQHNGYCVGKRTDVGSYSPTGDSWIGAQDMAGNVWEWVSDWYDSAYYTNLIQYNPTGPTARNDKVLRGGSWDRGIFVLRSTYRYSSPPIVRDYNIGFRCVRSSP